MSEHHQLCIKSAQHLRKDGYAVSLIFDRSTNTTGCVFGMANIIAFHTRFWGCLLVCVLNEKMFSKTLKKLLSLPYAKDWIRCGNRLMIHSWKRNKRKWSLEQQEIDLRMFQSNDNNHVARSTDCNLLH